MADVSKSKETPALLVIDMVKDYFDVHKPLPVTSLARPVIGPINSLISVFRQHEWPVVFSTDAFHAQDFIFQGKMKPHALAGTEGAGVIDELDRSDDDLWLPKPRFSAFFKTDLDRWLRKREITLCAVAGIATHFCVLTTALDAICHDFKAVLLEDCTASFSKSVHQHTLDIYRQNPLYPLLKVATASDLISELD